MSYVSTVSWPKRAVVTAGMPYGNKKLHFGHVAGVFVPADAYARFLRDRLGAENVLFVSGTDCFGSPIQEGYRKACENEGFEGTIEDYVRRNHDAQKATLEAYDVALSIYEGSGLGRAGEVHRMVTDAVLRRLHENGHLNTMETLQFYDTREDVFLNGRQVLGHCPVQGCKSEKAYADECDLGHQFNPEDLIKPVSTLSGEVPEMRPVRNWYFDLPNFRAQLQTLAEGLEADEEVRPVVVKGAKEFLVPPVMYIKNELEDDYRAIADKLPAHTFHEAEKGKQSFEIEFESIEDRDAARDVLFEAGVRFRTGKALVPFRISGNVEWGVPVPEMDGVDGLTVWCWPESLWAPISFSATALEARGESLDSVRDWWCSPDACVYQFIGQDNLYFYGVAQPALWVGLEEGDAMQAHPAAGQLQQTRLIANHHILFGKTKASSSGAVKPPSADDLLEHYTVEQLRAHWLGLGLDQKSVGFKPKPFDPDEAKRTDPRVADPALKEGALLTNVFNRLARSCFYEAQKSFDGFMPLGAVSAEAIERAHAAMAEYERIMHRSELHSIMTLLDEFIRWAQKLWADGIKAADTADDMDARRQVLIDSFYLLRVCALLMHPVAPAGCEKIAAHLNIPAERVFSWNEPFEGMEELCSAEERAAGRHAVVELPPRTDFFEKHPSQFK
ncbi:MAG: class I tRNA ligase family protein [Slackia sp.]|nr:class I tRNA ligase family protein [Slackia sp.]